MFTNFRKNFNTSLTLLEELLKCILILDGLYLKAAQIGVSDLIVRSNLTILKANKKYYDLPNFFKAHNIHVVYSLPYYKKDKTDRQRGKGVFYQSIKAL